MTKYYTKACNFYFGSVSREKVKKKLSIPLHGNPLISFDVIEVLSRGKSRRISIKKINSLQTSMKKKVILDLKQISKKNFSGVKLFKFTNFNGGIKSNT